MRRIKVRLLGGFLLALALPGFAGAAGLNNPPVPLSVEAEGMGEAVAADGTLFNATAFNPALLSNAPYTGEIALGFNASESIFSISKYLSSGATDLPVKPVDLGVGFNLALKFDDNWGFQIYNNSHGLFNLSVPGNMEVITGQAYLDTVAMVTYSFNPLEEETPLTVGVNLKVVDHRIGPINSSENPGSFSDFTNQLEDVTHQETLRWGLDLGLLYEFQPEHFALGLSMLDLFHSAGTIDGQTGNALYGIDLDPAPVVMKFGASWNPIKAFVINADVDDLLSDTSYYQGQGMGSHLKLGAVFNLLGILQLRGGVSNEDLSAGVGIPFLGLEYAYAVDDLNKVYTHFLEFRVVK